MPASCTRRVIRLRRKCRPKGVPPKRLTLIDRSKWPERLQAGLLAEVSVASDPRRFWDNVSSRWSMGSLRSSGGPCPLARRRGAFPQAAKPQRGCDRRRSGLLADWPQAAERHQRFGRLARRRFRDGRRPSHGHANHRGRWGEANPEYSDMACVSWLRRVRPAYAGGVSAENRPTAVRQPEDWLAGDFGKPAVAGATTRHRTARAHAGAPEHGLGARGAFGSAWPFRRPWLHRSSVSAGG